MHTPPELWALMAAMAALSLILTFAIRSDFRGPNGSMDWWGVVEGALSQFFILAMLVSAGLQVIVRHFFSDTIDLPWTEEFGRLALVWAAFWGAAALQRIDDHIRMTVVYDLAPPALQKAMRLFGDIVTLAILAPLIWLGWETARSLDIMHTISLGMPLSTFVYPVPVALALMFIHTLAIMIGRLRGHEPKAPEDMFAKEGV